MVTNGSIRAVSTSVCRSRWRCRSAKNASCPWVPNARCTALPEADSRNVNRLVLVLIPRMITHRSAKSTSPSAPNA